MIVGIRFKNTEENLLTVTYSNGKALTVPVDPLNKDYQEALNSGIAIESFVEPTPSLEDYSNAIKNHFDLVAQEMEYDDAKSCVDYRGDTIRPDWAAQAEAFFQWRSLVWTYAFNQYALVASGNRQPPTISTLLSELPTINWPQ